MSESHDASQSETPLRPQFRSAAFERFTLHDWLLARARQSPYLAIAAAINLTLLAMATVWKLGSGDGRSGAAGGPLSIQLAESPKAQVLPTAEEMRKIFDEQDAEVEEMVSDVFPDDSQIFEVMEPEKFKISDHYETDNDEPYGMVKGEGATHGLIGEAGKSPFDTIGVGGGSSPGGRGGAGGGLGGMQNTRMLPTKRASTTVIQAADSGLRWLARHQGADGSWSPSAFTHLCQSGTVCRGEGYPEHEVGVTALALLAFLGAGYDSRSNQIWVDPFSQRKIRAGDVVKSAVQWLRAQQDEQGSFVTIGNSKWGYNQAVATLALAEAYGLSRNAGWKESAQKAVDNLVSGQTPAPGGTGYLGWRYRPGSADSDISVTGWAVMALKSAQMANLKVPQSALEGALQFCEEVTDKTNGRVGYTRREEAGQQVKAPGKNDDYQNHPALEAVGMCVRIFAKHDISDPMLEIAAKLMSRDLPEYSVAKKTNDAYYWYYASLALNQFDGPDSPRAGKGAFWNPWKTALNKALVESQHRDPKRCDDGSWEPEDRWAFEGGRVYLTALNTLTLEVYYRYPNVFGRR
ncbi:MAG: terpene cyclase/mutase family protein [Planctomycetes bacterium]|nr:terpene cyclase/mutase family protein [Planctomycetota bacterium]